MKLAILGDSSLALEAALRFHFHGASLTLFNFKELSYFESVEVSDIGRSVLKEMDRPELPSNLSPDSWKELYQAPLLAYLRTHQMVKSAEVVSVTKRFLKQGEEIPNKSRFYDLFRVIFQVDPKEFIEEQRLTDPAKYQKLSEEFVGSLQSTIEMYEDFDVVMDFRRAIEPSSVAYSGRALGEKRISQEKISYGLEAAKLSKEFNPNAEVREAALIGSGLLSAEVLINLENWLSDERSRLFIISTEASPYSQFFENAIPEKAKKLKELFSKIEESHQKEMNEFHQKLRQWQELDDFVQVKIPKPAEPIPQVNFFSGHNVTAVDELIDRKRLFLTLEKPDFREGLLHAENNRVELKTIGVDFIFAAHEPEIKTITTFLNPSEKGYFKHTPQASNLKNAWEKDTNVLKGIEDEIFKLFSPIDHH